MTQNDNHRPGTFFTGQKKQLTLWQQLRTRTLFAALFRPPVGMPGRREMPDVDDTMPEPGRELIPGTFTLADCREALELLRDSVSKPARMALSEHPETGKNARPSIYLGQERDYTKYYTPREWAFFLVTLAEVADGQTIMEPSCGAGAIIEEVYRQAPKTTVWGLEPNKEAFEHCKDLIFYPESLHLLNQTFEDYIQFSESVGEPLRYDRVIMNPPFDFGKAGRHLQLAADLLKPGGILVAIMPADETKGFWLLSGDRIYIQPLKNWAANSDGTITPISVVKVEKSWEQ